jgi:Histone acetyltransferase
MVGLPNSTGEDEMATARAICEMGAEGTRIYPLAVLRGTELEHMVKCGEYTPIPLDETVSRTADVLEMFNEYAVKVLRVGLCASEELFSDDGIAAGEYSPAMGELAMGELYLRSIKAAVASLDIDLDGRKLSVKVPRGATSKAVGQHGANRAALIKQFGAVEIKYTEDPELCEYEVKVKIIL